MGEGYGVYGAQCVVGWNHIAVVRDGRGYTVYTNGVSGSGTANPQVEPGIPSTILVGQRSGGSQFFNGFIDAIRITNGQPRYTANFTPATLVADDMTTLMWEFNGAVDQKWVKELSGNSAMIAANGNARMVRDGRYIPPSAGATISTAAPKLGTGSLQGAGAGVGPVIPWSADLNMDAADFVIDFWIYMAGAGTSQAVCVQHAGSTANFFIIQGPTGSVTLTRVNGGSSWSYSTNDLSFGQWHHVAFVRTGVNLKTYADGVLKTEYNSAGSTNNVNGDLRFFADATGTGYFFCGKIDEFRISVGTNRGWSSAFTPPTIPYGQQYVTGPFFVATAASSSIDVTDWSTIHAAAVTQTVTPGGTIKWVVSFDGRTTWKYWTGSVWASIASLTAASIDTSGNDAATLQAALTGLNVEAYSTIDFAFSLKTANPNFSPSVDAVTLARDEYELGAAKIDYTIKRNGAAGAEIHRITNLKAYPVNVVYDYVA